MKDNSRVGYVISVKGAKRPPRRSCLLSHAVASVAHARSLCVSLLLFLMTAASGSITVLPAQERPHDLADLSLEELMEIDVRSINVLGTHTHLAGDWMVGYRYMLMSMNGNRDGTTRISTDNVLQGFPVTPTKMTMQMHMLEVMYAPSDNLTVMVMLPYRRLSMDHQTRMGTRFTTTSAGIGDLKLQGLFTVLGDVGRDIHRLVLTAGWSLPTGSVHESDDTPAGPDQQLPYPMQLGSGAVNVVSGITYLGETRDWAWSVEAVSDVGLGTNGHEYQLGNRFRGAAWGVWALSDWFGPSLRLDAQRWENIEGADPSLNPSMVPTADPARRGGRRIDLSVGINFYIPRGRFEGNRVALEFGRPVYQSLDGPQLETNWGLSVGWNWTF